MHPTFLITVSVIAVAAIVLSVYFGTKKCCGQAFKRSELYDVITPGTDEYDARMLQQPYMLPSDDISERGGSYEMLAGDGPMLSPKQDPWIRDRSYL